MEAVREMARIATHDLIKIKGDMAWLTNKLEAMASMKSHVLIRFGKWEDIIAEPLPEDKALYLNTTAMMHYARAIAFATLGRLEEADEERGAFKVAQSHIPPDTIFFQNNPCEDIFKVAEAMMNGEVEYHKGNYEVAFEHLRHAVYLDDHLLFSEPWAWMMPTVTHSAHCY